MNQGICALSNIPVRKVPGSSSEMVNMLLFGETYEVSSQEGDWFSIISSFDGYSGWINNRQYTPLLLAKNKSRVTSEFPYLQVHYQSGKHLILPGSEIVETGKNEFELNGISYRMEHDLKPNKLSVIETARQYLNTPYLWGGRSPFGIDCSGFTQIVYKIHGLRLRRDAWQQAEQGETVAFREAVQPGDLAFFDNEQGKIIHTGMMIDPDHIIHASGRVRIDKLDHFGIYDSERKEYSHKLRIIKRLTDSIV